MFYSLMLLLSPLIFYHVWYHPFVISKKNLIKTQHNIALRLGYICDTDTDEKLNSKSKE